MQSVRVRRGQTIRVGSIKNHASLYIAIEGGFAITPELGSISTDCRGALGGWQGRSLIAGDILPLCRAKASERIEFQFENLELPKINRFRVVLGPQSDHFADEEIERFFASEYVVSAGSNRMGMRLSGAPIRHRQGFNIISDGVAPGSIQVPGDGLPIALLADHQTTGGYPKIATVISADLPALGRSAIGSKISFAPVSLDEAVEARRKLFQLAEGLRTKIVPVPPPSTEVASRLLACNLISGVCDAAA
jgi:biotin-dependent carboxylase-like uncharacterized protein